MVIAESTDTPDSPGPTAFSCYVFDQHGRLLVTRLTSEEGTRTGFWTGSCYGHPLAGQSLHQAVVCNLNQTLGLLPRGVRLLLPGFIYSDQEGDVVRHELCPIFACRVMLPAFDTVETADRSWWSWENFVAAAAVTNSRIAPSARLQAAQLDDGGDISRYLRDTDEQPTAREVP